MAKRANPLPQTPRNMKWPPGLWADVLKCAQIIGERELIDLRPQEFVRRAVRKEVRAVLTAVAA